MVTTITQADLNSRKYFQTEDGTVYKKPGFGKVVGSVAAGITAESAIEGFHTFYTGKKLDNNLHNYAKSVHDYDKANGNMIYNAMKKMAGENPEILKAGTEIFDYTSEWEKPLRGKVLMNGIADATEPININKKFDVMLYKLEDSMHSRFMSKKGFDTEHLLHDPKFLSDEWFNAENEFYSKHKILSKIIKLRSQKGIHNLNKYNTAYPNRFTKEFFKNPEKPTKMFKILDKINALKFSIILFQMNSYDKQAKMGLNAFQLKNAVFVNANEDLKFSLPHELSHALHENSKGLPKLIKLLYNPSLRIPVMNTRIPLTLVPLAVALFRRKKVDGEESNTFVGKSLDFVKNNCVGITAALCAPKVIEEASASIGGIKMMKGDLPKKEMKMLKGFLGRAGLTYLAGFAVTVGSVWAVNTVKNIIDKPKKVELV